MDRRRFVKDFTQAGIGLGVPGLILDAEPGGEHSTSSASLSVANTVARLAGNWLLTIDPANVGREQKWYLHTSPEAKPARVPGIFQEVFPGFHGVVWYWREFTPPAHAFAQGRYLLSFGAVAYLTEVWVNGIPIGGHEGSETPFVLDATHAVKPHAANLLAVRVLKPGDTPIDGYVLKEIPHRNEVLSGFTPGSSYDYGGIVEPVELLLAPAVRIENLHVRPDWKTGNIRVSANIRNTTSSRAHAHLQFSLAPAATGKTLSVSHLQSGVSPGDTLVETQLHVESHRLWDLQDPYLYRLTVRTAAEGVDGFDENSVRLGFRDFRVERGYFRLNGKRIFLRSTHTGNHCPFSQILPPAGAPDFLRLDMLYAKASGFNAVRFISGAAHPYQLDLCDEIGLLVYEESLAGWLLADSPKMKERFEFSVREMVLRDRNHPCIGMFGMLNETYDGPVFRAAVAALPIARDADEDRLVLLSSGRWDGRLNIGSVSNPGSKEWDSVWGTEGPNAPWVGMSHYARDYWWKTGDLHHYPKVPENEQEDQKLRTNGEDSKPVFQSEYGIGSMMDVIHEARMYEQHGIRPEAEDYVIVKSMADNFTADWKRFGMEGVCAFPEFLLRDSQLRSARHRRLGFNVLRSNPKNSGFNLTGMLDHGLTGEGVWRFWRDWKPGVMDAMQDGWSPLRWCLFAYPTHTYTGRPLKLEAVLANEDVLRAGAYPVRFLICGPAGIAWEHAATVRVDTPPAGEDGPLAIPVMAEEVTLKGPEGDYELAASIEQGAAGTEASWQFHLTDPASLPRVNQAVTLWGVAPDVERWLEARGATCSGFQGSAPARREIILVGDVSKTKSNIGDWKELARRMARGSVAVFLSPQAFQREKDDVGWLPLDTKGRCYQFNDWLYHKECVAKTHPVFEGLPGKGILDFYYYGPVIPHYIFDGQSLPAEVVAAAFTTGYPVKGGYASGILLGRYEFGAGHFFVNTFPILEQLDQHPAADRLLLNLVNHAGSFIEKPLEELPGNFDDRLRAIGYA